MIIFIKTNLNFKFRENIYDWKMNKSVISIIVSIYDVEQFLE